METILCRSKLSRELNFLIKQNYAVDTIGKNVRNRACIVFLIIVFAFHNVPSYSKDLSQLSVVRGNYSIKTNILMPHLEHSLRFANTDAHQCLNQPNATSLFPVLKHASFNDCALIRKQPSAVSEEFNLICANPEAATGTVRFIINDKSFRGTLKIKMGGKNMKFSQQIRGSRIGEC